MKRASVLFGLLLGLAAIVFAWWRAVPAALAPAVGTPERPLGAARPDGDASLPPAPLEAANVFASDVDALRARALLIPVEGLSAADLRDDFTQARAGGTHQAIDLLAPRRTRVLAADNGFVAKLFTSARGGLTVYQFDRTQSYCYYYAHLDGYAPGLREGRALRKGELVGFVGTTGNAPPQTPHLHFAIFKLGAKRRWWEGVAINPFQVWANRS